MKTFGITKRIALTGSSLVLISVLIAGVGLLSIRRITTNLHTSSATVQATQGISAIQALALEYRGTSLLMGTPALASDYKQNQIAHLVELETQVADLLRAYGAVVSDEERPLFAETVEKTKSLMAACKRFRELAITGKSREAGAFWSKLGGPQSKAFRKAVQAEVNFKNKVTSATLRSGVSTADLAYGMCWILLGVALSAGLLLCLWVARQARAILRSAARDLESAAEQVACASREVASASQNLAQASSQQAASLEETSENGKHVSSMAKETAMSCRSVATLMDEAERTATQATQHLDDTVASMNRITGASDQIQKIIHVIDGIAFQTNILSLNAAVEAARAGEAGMGFAIVADEVRTLAGRCSEAAKDVTASIAESVESALAGKKQLDEAAVFVRRMTESATKVRVLLARLDQDTDRQTLNVDQISKALGMIEQGTQQTAAMAEQSASASEQLRAQADALEDVVSTLKALI